jgi:acylphosphatase
MDGVGKGETRVECRMVVSGRVQGVGFRAFLRDRARALRVAGWARNLPDGAVEIEAGGEGGAMAEFVRSVRAGPPWARVASVSEEPRSAGDALPDPFTILR